MRYLQLFLIIALLTACVLMAALMGFVFWRGYGNYAHLAFAIAFIIGGAMWIIELAKWLERG